jgi:hypothetical protein
VQGSLVQYGDGAYADARVPSRPAPPSLGRWIAAGFSIVMIVTVLSPVAENWRRSPQDGFPLSYYPMFTADRTDRTSVTYLLGVDGQGNRTPLRYTFAGTGGLNQVHSQMKKAVRQGEAAELCRSAASRVAQRRAGPLGEVVSVQVVTGTYRLVDYFGGDKTPVSERVQASCDVRRSRQ